MRLPKSRPPVSPRTHGGQGTYEPGERDRYARRNDGFCDSMTGESILKTSVLMCHFGVVWLGGDAGRPGFPELSTGTMNFSAEGLFF